MLILKIHTMTGSLYRVAQDDAGNHKVISSTNPDHQHIGEECSPPVVGRRLLVNLPNLQVCRTSEIVKIEPEE